MLLCHGELWARSAQNWTTIINWSFVMIQVWLSNLVMVLVISYQGGNRGGGSYSSVHRRAVFLLMIVELFKLITAL